MKRSIYIKLSSIAFMLLGGLSACSEDPIVDKYEVPMPVVMDFTPKTGIVGTEITITGENLQRADTVRIGGGLAEIKYRINPKEMVAVVLSSSRTGKVQVSNFKGSSESSDAFTVTYLTPAVTNYPTEGTVNEDIILNGENLHVIDSVMLDNVKAGLIAKSKDELVFRVPYVDSEEPVTIKLHYFNGTTEVFIGPGEGTFNILKEKPEATVIPESLTKYQPAKIEGEHLLLIEALYIGEIKAEIKFQSDTEIRFDMPTDYFGGNMSGELRAIYYGVRQLILNDNFQVYSDPNEPRFFTHTNVTLSAREAASGTERAFYDAETNTIFSSCELYDNRLDVDFFAYDQSGYVQIYGPHQSGNTLKNFKCEGKSIDSGALNWNDFYGTGGIETKFKVLSKDSVNHIAVIEAFEKGTITELNDEFFEGIPSPGTSGPRIYSSVENGGTSHFSVDKFNIGWVRNYTTGKNGIIKFTGVSQQPGGNGRLPEVTFDILWQK